MGKKDRSVEGKKAGKGKNTRSRRLPLLNETCPPGTVLTQDPNAPQTWCVFCRADRHDVCSLAEMTFCDCFRDDHEEVF